MSARSQELEDQLRRERTLAALKAYYAMGLSTDVDSRERYNELLKRHHRRKFPIHSYSFSCPPLDHDEIFTLLGDLLCDLHHLADLETIDWDETVRSAECVYLAEKAEDQEEQA